MPPSAFVDETLNRNSGHLADIGVREVVDTTAILASIQAAKILPRTKQIVVLDAAPPFVKIFNWDGSHARSFLYRGGGPGEMRTAASMGVLGDSLILVADLDGRLTVFDLEGRRLGERTLPGLWALAIVDMCGSWGVYGPRSTSSDAERPDFGGHIEWFRAFSPTLDTEVPTDRLSAPLSRDAQIGFGKAFGIVRHQDSVLIRHDQVASPAIVAIRCDSVASFHRVAGLDRHNRIETTAGDRQPVPPGRRFPAGMMSLPTGTVLVDGEIGARSGSTTFSLTGPDGSRIVSATELFAVRDQVPGVGVLFEAVGPVPRLLLLSEHEVTHFFER